MARMFLEKWEQLAGAAGYDARKLAKLYGHSVRQLERDFQDNFGRSPQDCLNEERGYSGNFVAAKAEAFS